MTRKSLISAAAAVFVVAFVARGVWRVRDVFVPAVPRPRATRVRVAAVGDSNTYGAGVLMNRMHRNAYPARLEALLGRDHQVLNYGASGRTLLDSGDRPYRAYRFFDISHEVRPDVVLIMLGTNDAKPFNWDAARYQAELRAFVDSYTSSAEGASEVYLLTPPAAWPNKVAIDPAVVRDEVVPIVKRVGAEAGVRVVDVYEATRDARALFPDGVHPNARGYEIIARTVYAAMQER
jgi:lysophospholipase L1-like esterase